jgi:hypothetical protein
MHFCSYHQADHPDKDFGKRASGKLDSWCRRAKAERKRTGRASAANGDRSRSGRPRWNSAEDRLKIKAWLDEEKSYSWIGRQFGRQASQISLLVKTEGWEKGIYAQKQENPSKFSPTKQICTNPNCELAGVEQPIDNFPLRTDRPGKYHAQCNNCYFARRRELNQGNYEKYDGALYASKKRAIIAEATIGDKKDNQEYAAILRKDPCCICGALKDPDSDDKIQIDHIEPLAPGAEKHGDHDWTNFTATCAKCNNEKNDITLLEYLLRIKQ